MSDEGDVGGRRGPNNPAAHELRTEAVARLLRNIESQLKTVEAVAQSMVNATDKDTPEGRKARLTLKVIRQMQRRLENLSDEEKE